MSSYIALKNDEFKDNMFKSIFGIAVSVGVLLCCMFLFKHVFSGTLNTLFNILSLFAASFVLFKALKLQKLLGSKIIVVTWLIMAIVVVVMTAFSRTFLYDNVLGETINIVHGEHDLMFNEMSIISSKLSEGKTIAEATDGLPLNQYYNIFVYSSFMFLFGGINVTNMCIWAMFHSVINTACMVLMVYAYGIRDKNHLSLVYFATILQPLMLNIHVYNKVIIGETFVILAMYIYVKTYRNTLHNILCFPAYAWLFWSMRQQYLVIAVVLCLLMFFINGSKLNFETIFEFMLVLLVFLVLFLTTDVRGYINEDLNFDGYTQESTFSIIQMPMRIIRGFISYFPFTQIFTDDNWTFNLFCMFQVCVNITLWGYVLINAVKGKKLKEVFFNPMVLAAAGLFFAGAFSALHTTYVSVGTMLLTSAIKDVQIKKVLTTVAAVFAALSIISIVYAMMGLTGTGTSGIVI